MSEFQPYTATIDRLCNQCSGLMYTNPNPKPIQIAELNGRYITRANTFLLDAFDLKKRVQYMIDVKDPELLNPNSETIERFKLLIDIAEIWQNPKLLCLVEELKSERELEVRLERDIELKKEENRNRFLEDLISYQNPSYGDGLNLHHDMINIHVPQQNTQKVLDNNLDNDICSDVSEDEFMAEDVAKLIDKGYNDINAHSILQNIYNVERYNHCNLIDNEEYQ